MNYSYSPPRIRMGRHAGSPAFVDVLWRSLFQTFRTDHLAYTWTRSLVTLTTIDASSNWLILRIWSINRPRYADRQTGCATCNSRGYREKTLLPTRLRRLGRTSNLLHEQVCSNHYISKGGDLMLRYHFYFLYRQSGQCFGPFCFISRFQSFSKIL